MFNHIAELLKNASLKKILSISLILTICLIAAAYYVESAYFASRVILETSRSLEYKIRQGIFEHIENYLSKPEYVNKINLAVAGAGSLNLENEKELTEIFLGEVLSGDVVDYVYYANAAGGIVSVGRFENQYTVSQTSGMKAGPFVVSQIDTNGNRLGVVKTVTDFDPRTRSWYGEAKRTKQNYWSEVYAGVSVPTLGITASSPLIDSNGNVIGVFGSDVLLDSLSEYISTLDISKNGRAYLIEPNGLLIASSEDSSSFFRNGSKLNRVAAETASDPVLKGSWGILKEKLAEKAILSGGAEKYRLDGENYYVDLSRYTYGENLNWYLMIAIPEKDFAKDTNKLFMAMTALILLFLALSVFLSVILGKRILRPIQILNQNVLDIRRGQWGTQIETHRSDELGELAKSFNQMSTTIKESYDSLVKKNNELEFVNANLEQIVKERTEELRTLSITDELTGLYNHRFIIEALKRKVEEKKRYGHALSVALLDIDFFKRVNDNFGHLGGNEVLRTIGKHLREGIRSSDIAGRYGGEEFLLILPDTTAEDAFLLTEKLRIAIAGLEIGEAKIRVTVSGGVASCACNDVNEIIRIADRNLYKAKETGRNRVVN